MMTKLLDTLAQRKHQAEAAFWSLAEQLANEAQVDAAEAERILANAGKTGEDLRLAVEVKERRKRLLVAIHGADTVEQERTRLLKRRESARQAFEQARRVCDEICEPLESKLADLLDRSRRANEARRELFRECPYQPLKQEYQRLTEQMERLSSQRATLQKQADRTRDAVDHEREAELTPSKAVYWRNLAQADRRAAEAATRELPAIEAEIVQLERELKATEARMIEP